MPIPPAFSVFGSGSGHVQLTYLGIYVSHMPWFPQQITGHMTRPEISAILAMFLIQIPREITLYTAIYA